MSWDPITGKLRVDPDPRGGDTRPRWSNIEARIASGEVLPPQSEWIQQPEYEYTGPQRRPPTDPGEWGTDLGPSDRPYDDETQRMMDLTRITEPRWEDMHPTDPREWGTDLGQNDRPFPSDPTIDDLWPGGCPSPKERIQLANNDWILAGELKVGDEVATSEDPQKVTRVQRLENRARCEVLFEDSDSIVTSYSHPYFVNSKGFVEVGNLE